MINGQSDAYVNAAVRGEIERLASANVGDRNNSLFRSAASLSSLGLREGQIIQHLRPTAEFIGLKGREFYSTIKSGVKNGQGKLRSSLKSEFCSATGLGRARSRNEV